MKKFAISIAALAIATSACGDENNEEENSNPQNEHVEENIETNVVDNNGDNNSTADSNDDADNNGSTATESAEEIDSVLDQGVENFELHLTLVDDAEWSFTHESSENGDPEASISGNGVEMDGEAAVEEMESYLAEFHINAESGDEVISEIADTFAFNESSFREYELMIDFSDQETETEWSWIQDEDGVDLSDHDEPDID